jgi:hypothetical protein
LPRARLAGAPFYAAGERDAVSALDRLGRDVRNRLVVEDPDRPLPSNASPVGTARIAVDEPERVEVETRSDSASYLVLADTFDPGWSATVDGRPAPIRPAWVAFRAVFIPAGAHRVVFRYRPAGFLAGLAVSLAGLAVALGLLAWRGRMAELRPAHDVLSWPEHWPRWALLAAAAIVAASAVGLGPNGEPAVNARWANSLHQFTWGAGIQAMREGPRG